MNIAEIANTLQSSMCHHLTNTRSKRDEIISAMKDMALDVNSEEIKAHDTDLSLRQWTLAWGSKMMELIGALEQNEKADVPDTDVCNIGEDADFDKTGGGDQMTVDKVVDICRHPEKYSSHDQAACGSHLVVMVRKGMLVPAVINPEKDREASRKYCKDW